MNQQYSSKTSPYKELVAILTLSIRDGLPSASVFLARLPRTAKQVSPDAAANQQWQARLQAEPQQSLKLRTTHFASAAQL